MKNSFINCAANPNNPKWNNIISREHPLYKREHDVRSDFERDYTRIIHSTAYRRLKHKTQVFFSPNSDHICTRIEHVTHVESISYTIANYLGLNTELTKAISVGHDLGHAPFGHKGEDILSSIMQEELNLNFWHEQNSLNLVDNIEILENNEKQKENMYLTYGVRDGIISHCGEIDEIALRPRDEFIDLNTYQRPNQHAPYTWEGCVVKIADKISYIGRDIEDAIALGILDDHLEELHEILNFSSKEKINNTIVINKLISDVCESSSPEKGLCFSAESYEFLSKIKEYNYKNIYNCKLLDPSVKYFNLVLRQIFETLKDMYAGKNTINSIEHYAFNYPTLSKSLKSWVLSYFNVEGRKDFKNKILFDIENRNDFIKSVVYYISGMTDNFAMEIYNEIIGF